MRTTEKISNFYVGNVMLAVFKAADMELIGILAPPIRTGTDAKCRSVSLKETLADFSERVEELKAKSAAHLKKREKDILEGRKIELPESHLSDSYDVLEQIDYVLERETAVFDNCFLGEELKDYCFKTTIKNDLEYLKKTLPKYIDAKADLLKSVVSGSF